jgi:hypothetical protein
MSTKQALKKAKRAAVSKQKKKAANIERASLSKEVRRAAPRSKTRRPLTSEAMNYRIATQGVLKTARELADNPENAKVKLQEMTNNEVLKGIREMIPVLGGIHGGIEVACRLVDEKKLELLPHQAEIVENFDRKVVAVSEDIHAMYEFMEAGQTPDDYMSIFIHYIDILAEMVQFSIPEALEQLLSPIEDLVNEYVKEHRQEGETSVEFGMRISDERIDRVAPLYRTTQALEDEPVEGEFESAEEQFPDAMANAKAIN